LSGGEKFVRSNRSYDLGYHDSLPQCITLFKGPGHLEDISKIDFAHGKEYHKIFENRKYTTDALQIRRGQI